MRKLLFILLATAMLLSGTACSPKAQQEESARRLQVYASIYPVYDFALRIAGDKGEVRLIMPYAAEPHDWEPTTQDIVNLEQADVFLYNGAGMEHWVDTILSSLQNKDLIAVNTSDEAALLGAELLGSREDHHAVDPHVWLSISNAKLQAQTIADALTEADPANADYYRQTLQSFQDELTRLDAEYRAALSGMSRNVIVTAHEAYGYLCLEYGLEQVSAQGFFPDAEPDPASMAQVVDFCREHGVKVIFFENPADPKVARAIAAETGASVEVLTPIESISDEDRSAGMDYLSLMRRNLEALKKALTD